MSLEVRASLIASPPLAGSAPTAASIGQLICVHPSGGRLGSSLWRRCVLGGGEWRLWVVQAVEMVRTMKRAGMVDRDNYPVPGLLGVSQY